MKNQETEAENQVKRNESITNKGKEEEKRKNISTPSPEKDSLFGPTVHKKIAYQILKKEVFFGSPFN